MEGDKELRQNIIEDLQKADKQVEGILTREEYLEKGEYSSKEVRQKAFDSWSEAKEAAGIKVGNKNYDDMDVTREDLLEELRRIEDKEGTNWYEKTLEHAEYSVRYYRHVFGTLGEAVKEAGCKLYRDDDQSKEDSAVRQAIIDKLQELEEDHNFVSSGHIDRNPVRYFDGGIDEARREAGLEIADEEDHYRVLSETVKSELSHGFYKSERLSKLSKKHHGVSIPSGNFNSIKTFVEYFNENNEESITLNADGGNSQGFFYDDGSYSSEDRYEEMMRRKYSKFVGLTRKVGNPELFDEFKELVGKGVSPSVAYGCLLYYSYDGFTQDEVAEDIGISTVSIRDQGERTKKVLNA